MTDARERKDDSHLDSAVARWHVLDRLKNVSRVYRLASYSQKQCHDTLQSLQLYGPITR